MIRNVLSLTAALCLASACATNNPQTASPEPAAQPQATAPAQQQSTAPAPAQVATTAPAAKKEFHPDDMVCRIYDVTGSRVQKQRICKTRQQWIDDARAAQEAMRALQDGNAAQPGGQQLVPGGGPN